MYEMSRYTKLILIGFLLIAPKIAGAKTITFGDKQWVLETSATDHADSSLVQNISAKNISQHILLGRSLTKNVQILDAQTITQIEAIEQEVNQPVQNAQLEIKDGWATTFAPDKDGQAVDLGKLSQLLTGNSDNIILPVLISKPQTKLSDLNTVGINELVATGVSDYTGSSKNRIVNVTVGSSKYDGLILQPGEEFSFNKYLGDIDAAHGFKPEQVIKASGIELEFGGGLCQVSTTMFRAAMNAGFPITQRRNHSFAVHYYYPQGTDATIYPGSSDLKFVNNFKTPVLIHTYIDSPNVHFDVYGTKDNRVVTFEGPVIYDRQASGAMKATWTRHVTLNGETTDYVAKSNYVSPALFHKVDQAATPNPQATATPANTQTNPTPTPTPPQTNS
jgi:vancomycin resistance protein YoaR